MNTGGLAGNAGRPGQVCLSVIQPQLFNHHGICAKLHGTLLEFLQYAVQYLFPAQFIPKARGVPTGLAAPVFADFSHDPELQDLIVADAPLQVWPSHLGSVVGVGVLPLIANAPSIASLDPSLYRWFALVDVLRGGDVRARTFARRVLPKLVAALP